MIKTIGTWLYLLQENGKYSVGFFKPTGEWRSESEWEDSEQAQNRVNYLNGGETTEDYAETVRLLKRALKPFAELDLEGTEDTFMGDDYPVLQRNATKVTLGDFKRARKLVD